MEGTQTHKVIFELVAAIAAATSILIYYEKKNHRALETEVLALDKNIKQLQLSKLTNTP
jgi:hypothetical protein